jgi:hypothetical protein
MIKLFYYVVRNSSGWQILNIILKLFIRHTQILNFSVFSSRLTSSLVTNITYTLYSIYVFIQIITSEENKY